MNLEISRVLARTSVEDMVSYLYGKSTMGARGASGDGRSIVALMVVRGRQGLQTVVQVTAVVNGGSTATKR